jgi:hypothetical protein
MYNITNFIIKKYLPHRSKIKILHIFNLFTKDSKKILLQQYCINELLMLSNDQKYLKDIVNLLIFKKCGIFDETFSEVPLILNKIMEIFMDIKDVNPNLYCKDIVYLLKKMINKFTEEDINVIIKLVSFTSMDVKTINYLSNKGYIKDIIFVEKERSILSKFSIKHNQINISINENNLLHLLLVTKGELSYCAKYSEIKWIPHNIIKAYYTTGNIHDILSFPISNTHLYIQPNFTKIWSTIFTKYKYSRYIRSRINFCIRKCDTDRIRGIIHKFISSRNDISNMILDIILKYNFYKDLENYILRFKRKKERRKRKKSVKVLKIDDTPTYDNEHWDF